MPWGYRAALGTGLALHVGESSAGGGSRGRGQDIGPREGGINCRGKWVGW